MEKTSKPFTNRKPRIQLAPRAGAQKSSEPSLLLQRLRELDREFARQTKQLSKLTKRIRRKFTDKM